MAAAAAGRSAGDAGAEEAGVDCPEANAERKGVVAPAATPKDVADVGSAALVSPNMPMPCGLLLKRSKQ